MTSPENCKPRIDYPCRWVYKLIGRDMALLRNAVEEVLLGRSCSAVPSRSSKGGARAGSGKLDSDISGKAAL